MLLRPAAARAASTPAANLAVIQTAIPTNGEVTLALDQAVQRAREVSALVRRARAESQLTAARRVGAAIRLPANPGVAVAVGPQRDDSAGAAARRGLGYRLHVEQAVEIGGQRGARLDEVERAVDAADARERLAEIESGARARAGYVAALLGTALVQSTTERETLAARMENSVRARVEAGAASEIELRLAEVERGRMHRERVDAQRMAGEALAELRALLALPPAAEVKLTTPLAAPTVRLPPLDQAIALALDRRADLAAVLASAATVDAQIVRLRREALPVPVLFLDVERDLPGQVFVGGGLGVALPVWRRNQGELAVARAERARADDEHEVVARQIALEVDRGYREVRAREEQARILETEVVPAAERARDLLTQGWQAGKFDLFRVIQVAREAGEARRHQIEALGSLWQATIELDRATGAP
ncbi:MAG TPA: TolC family protein [Polyangia bacterium]|nr:TolC family protein [Polyangia bacterium]